MPAFAYQAIDKSGKSSKGVLEGDNPRQIRQLLREQALLPLEVEQVKETKVGDKPGAFAFLGKLRQTRLSASELALLTRQLATLVESALPLEEALLAVA